MQRLHQRRGKRSVRLVHRRCHRRFLRRLVLLRGRKNQRRILLALGGRRGLRIRRFLNIAWIIRQAALHILRPNAPCRPAAVAAVKDHRQMNALVQSRVKDARQFAVAHIIAALVGVGGHQRAVRMHILAVYQHRQFIAQAVHAQRTMARVIKHNCVARPGHLHQILLHGRQYAVAAGLRRRKHHHSRPRLRRRWIGQQHHLPRWKSKLGTGQHIRHRLCIAH